MILSSENINGEDMYNVSELSERDIVLIRSALLNYYSDIKSWCCEPSHRHLELIELFKI